MAISEATIQEMETRVLALPEGMAYLFKSGELTQFVETVGPLYNLKSDQQTSLLNEIVLVLLFFTPLEAMRHNLEIALSIPPETAEALDQSIRTNLLTDEMSQFIDSINHAGDDEGMAPDSQEVLTTTPPSQTPKISATDSPSKTNAAILERLRTMEKDAERVHGYGAYRRKYPTPEEIRNQSSAPKNVRGSLTDLPKYTNE